MAKEKEVERFQGHKPFLGGYRHRRDGTEYHHAVAQTPGAAIKLPKDYSNCVSRETQVTQTQCKYQQTSRNKTTQTDIVELLLGQEDGFVDPTDRTLVASQTYNPADLVVRARAEKLVVLQRALRRWVRARREFRAAAAAEAEDWLEGQNGGVINLHLKEGVVPGQQAVAKEDFKRMIQELENSRKADANGDEDGRLDSRIREYRARAKKAKAVAADALQLAKISEIKDRRRASERDSLTRNVLLKTGQPKHWRTSSGAVVEVVTEETRRARDLAHAYLNLSADYDEEWDPDQQERVMNLFGVKEMAAGREFRRRTDGRELHELVSRELTLIERGVRASNLEGLRKRISSTLLRLIRSTEFNPDIARFEKALPMKLMKGPAAAVSKTASAASSTASSSPSSSTASSVSSSPEFCFGCRRHLPRTKFPLSSGAVVGRCVACVRLDNDARSGQDLSAFKDMMERIKAAEEREDNTTSPVFQMQDSDIRYMVQNFWDSQSILSGDGVLDNLRLVRWRSDVEWSPWNCALLTVREAKIHGGIGGLIEMVYGSMLIEKVRYKHTLAKNHFSKMTTMAKYFENNGTRR